MTKMPTITRFKVILAILGFAFPLFAQQGTSITDAIYLCSKTSHHISSLPVLHPEQILVTAECLNSSLSNSGVWLNFKIMKAGELSFTLVPLNLKDDLDFVVFSRNQANSFTSLRCMAQGRSFETDLTKEMINCLGMTGLQPGVNDLDAQIGCGNQSNFLSSLQVEENEEYFLYVQNYNSTSGFQLFFDEGEVSFIPDEKCTLPDKEVIGLAIGITPNPVHNNVSLKIESNLNSDTEVRLLDALGKVVFFKEYTENLSQIDLDATALTPGTYYVYVIQGASSSIRKFSKI